MILPTSKNAPLLLLLATAISIGGCDKKAADAPAESEADKTPKKDAEPAADAPEAEPADEAKDEAEEAKEDAQDNEAGDTD